MQLKIFGRRHVRVDERSVLQAKNLKAILWGFPRKIVPTTIQIIGDSVTALSGRHMGALIVLESKENIEII